MHDRAESEAVPRINASVDFAEHEWYKTLTRKATSISQLEERALVGARMSMFLLNVLGPKATGAMVEAILPEGKPVWLDQIRGGFLHPTSDSFAAYANTILGGDDGDDFDDTTDLTREELETRKKKKLDKSEKKEKKVEENVTGAPRKQPFNHLFLDYVVVSDTLSGLGAGEKRIERDPDDDETLTEIMKKKKVLEDKKKKLDEQDATALAAKKSKLQKETPPAPSESEIDLGVFSAKRANFLEKIYAASGSQEPPSDSRGKEKKDEVEQVENVTKNIAGASGDGDGDGGDGRGEGVDTEAESSGATPRHTIYTKRPSGSRGGGTLGVHLSPEFEHVQGGS
ncbi:hypothetical protein Hanom_Chr08g00728691 [Helianthus anomalus]